MTTSDDGLIIDFDFACRDDCLDKMVPSDLRQIIGQRDRALARIKELEKEVAGLKRGQQLLVHLHSILSEEVLGYPTLEYNPYRGKHRSEK